MLEILGMIWVSRLISKMLNAKNIKPAGYIVLMIVLWIGFEVLFIIAGSYLFMNDLIIYPLGIAGAALGGFLGYAIAKNAASSGSFPEDIIDAE